MSWARLDDSMPTHAKILMAGPLAELLHYRAICYACRYETDGFIAKEVLPTLASDFAESFKWSRMDEPIHVTALRLVTSALWHEVAGGWMIHDFLDYNPSRRDKETERRRNRQRQEEFRTRRRNAVSNGVSNGHVTAPRPVPSPLNTKPRAFDDLNLEERKAKAREQLEEVNRRMGRSGAKS